MPLARVFDTRFKMDTECRGRARHSVRAAGPRRALSDAPYHKCEVFELGEGQLHPEGMVENSPAFQRWVCTRARISPGGTAEDHRLSRPSGTRPDLAINPALKRWAILNRPFGTGARTPSAQCSIPLSSRLPAGREETIRLLSFPLRTSDFGLRISGPARPHPSEPSGP